MEVAEVEQLLRILDSSLSHIKWRLKSHAKHRLQIDVLALCTEMRPVIMVDYGGKMPELQEHLCALLRLCQQESPIFEHLKVMIIEDMIYLIHVKGLVEYVKSSLNSEVDLVFVNLEQDPPKMVTQAENSSLNAALVRVQKLFSLYLPVNENVSPCHLTETAANASDNVANAADSVANAADSVASAESSINKPIISQSSEFIDFSSCMQDSEVTVPTLNGWLLGYPVVYLFSKEHIADAIYNLSTKYLRIFQILVSRNISPNKASRPEELMSFSVPYELSMGGSKEPWAEAFLAQMQSRWEKSKQIWRTLQMEVSECYPQAIVL
ncbi:uncharacterized protein LOC8261710 isoform X1 [Ricinus communis]|uniref:Uncharacterized protein n=1 Tax=Ricinus communis TaxID=3988 RepID=B9T545_RICCO|nr:uncharacterized protein LOC8261710 isoform X1 [Ricinus communis]EEF29026.1 hypothetical protein RCOM_0453040 [Ricinus communis]|eukprot:XP_002533364.1 uncharacterized protein LOC8261710 [Ricinus communis]